MLCRTNSQLKEIKKMCHHVRNVYELFFLASFSYFISKKNAPIIVIFTGIVCLCVFHTRAKFYLKKYLHPTFWLCAKKSDFVARVGQLVGFLVCLSVGWTFIGQFVFFILFIDNLD